MAKYATDISPAIQELKKLHNLLLDHIEKNAPKGVMNTDGILHSRETVISVLPGERRREDGWYKWRMWEKRSDDILHELDPQYKVQKYHEIYVSGESLARPPEGIVLLMMHQVCHQAAAIASTQSYHGDWIKIWADRLFDIKQEAWERDPVLGWYIIDPKKMGTQAERLVMKLAKTLEPSNFDLFRVKLGATQSTGKMYKWMCSCGRPVLRTGGIPDITCNRCGTQLRLDPKGVPTAFWDRVPQNLRWDSEDKK